MAPVGAGGGGGCGGRRGAGAALLLQAGAAHHRLPLRRYASGPLLRGLGFRPGESLQGLVGFGVQTATWRRRTSSSTATNAAATEEEGKPDEKAATAKAVDVDVDWLLPPPPKAAFKPSAEEDNALRELRLKRQELAKWAESVHDILQDLDATARTEVVSKEQPEQIIIDDEPEPQVEKVREKIVISIQDKNARQQFRVFKDEKFDKLLKVYAKKAKLNPSDLAFVFDGEKVNLSSTPEDLDLEDDDMIEVRHKRHCGLGALQVALISAVLGKLRYLLLSKVRCPYPYTKDM
ncbi:hypothetical protein PVAP13_5NG357285 [Panicum virgatum]|uniref:Rad60/SUMO-like domain-containing protein n=1 Tax=Panicum virgatum TaxID=38727 RepID=A0A8T0RY08_PANVG|nr:hypothetical protein PVAP13_5NG357285 [Panicum virgatum]